MAVYVVSRLSIRNLQAMQRYVDQVVPVVESFGGRYLVRGSKVRALEGRWESDRMVVLEFPDEARAMAWYDSEAYRPLRELRQASAQAVILLAQGVPAEGAAP